MTVLINSKISRTVATAAAASALLALAGCATRNIESADSTDFDPQEPRRPNIIYILADDLGYGDIGPYGQEKIDTPNLDQMAERGMLFTQHYAGSTVCAPSRAVLMTGKHTGHVNVRGNRGLGGFLDENEYGQLPLDSQETTVAELLQEAGYETALIGKWGLGGPRGKGGPNSQGFDYFYGYLDQKQAHNYYPTHLWRDTERVELNNSFFVPHPGVYGGSELAEDYQDYIGGEYVPYLLMKEAKSFIARNSNRKFFLYFAPTIPHSALQVPDSELKRYAQAWEETPLNGGGYTPHPRPRAARAAMITLLDRQVGELIKQLERLGIADETLLIFTSDNGPTPEGGQDIDFFNSSGGLRGIKRELYEGGIRVPMIAYWPGIIAEGIRTDHMSAFWDVLPTFAELADAQPPKDIDGISFASVLIGEEAVVHESLYWEFHGGAPYPAQALRRGDWKLVRAFPVNSEPTVELYNLSEDPNELCDLSLEEAELVKVLLTELDSARTESPVPGFNFDPDAAPADKFVGK